MKSLKELMVKYITGGIAPGNISIVRLLASRIKNMYYDITSTEVNCSVGDIMLQRDFISQQQYTIASRFADIIAYLKGDTSFFYQNAISSVMWKNHDPEEGNRIFISLIDSYREKGYDNSSKLIADCDIQLVDGTHRVALNISQQLDTLCVKIWKRRYTLPLGFDWLVEKGFDGGFIESIKTEYFHIQDWLIATGNTFVCEIKDGTNDTYNSVIEDFKYLSNLLNVIRMECVGGGNYTVCIERPQI